MTAKPTVAFGIPDERRPYVSAVARQAHERGHAPTITPDNWKEHAAVQEAVSVSQKLERLLRYIVRDDPTNKAVIDRILGEIRRARFVVADFTGQRNSLYYEAAFAAGLGREVISCCREG